MHTLFVAFKDEDGFSRDMEGTLSECLTQIGAYLERDSLYSFPATQFSIVGEWDEHSPWIATEVLYHDARKAA